MALGESRLDPNAAVSPDGRFIAANRADRLVVVWERKGDSYKESASFAVGGTRLLFSPDSTRIAAGTRICELRTGKYWELDEAPRGIEAVAFSGDGKRLAAATSYEAFVWDRASGKRLSHYKTGPVHYTGIALDYTGEVLAVSPTWEPETVVFVDPMTGARIAGLAGPEKFRCVWANYAPDRKSVLLGDSTGVTWWDPAAKKLIRRFEGMAHSWAGGWNIPARFTPDGKILVGTSTRMLLRWDAATGKPILPDLHDAGHHSTVTGLGVSSDGKWIATGGYDAHVKVWDAKSGRPVSTFAAAWMLGL
jgi:WD40 repeat protein